MIHKKQQFIRLLLISVIIIAFSACSRSGFRGVIDYKISYPGSRIDYATQDALPAAMEVKANGNFVRKDMRGGELIQTQIANSEEESVDILLEIMGKKYHIKKNRAEIQADLISMPQPQLEFTGQTKEILGYVCQEAKAITYDDFGEETVALIYFTNDIQGFAFNFDLPYREIPGLMLQYELRTGDLNMRFEAERIRKRKKGTRKKSFKIPKDYEQITYDELRKKLE
jgi:GLPGLI family protein